MGWKILHRTFLFLCVLCCYPFSLSTPAATHLHTNRGSDEREIDGAYVPRGKDHFSEAGEHHAEFDHEAILGSVKEAEEYDSLPPEEAKKRLKILLTKMDLNKDGVIERKELHSWILRSFKMLSEEESAERFEDNDENGDGRLTWLEYLSDTFGVGSDEDNDLSENSQLEEDKLIKEDKTMFELADKDKNGYLDKSEFVLFSHPEEHPEMWSLIVQQTLDEKDTNSDGYIDFQEFIGERGKDKNKEWLLSEKELFDNEHDKDKDGRLNKDEILSWAVPSNDEIAAEEVDHLFASSDDDNDDLLNFDEIINHHDIFVGSEATDFGDHLHNIHVFQDEL